MLNLEKKNLLRTHVFEEINIPFRLNQYELSKCHLFSGRSKRSIKYILVYEGNEYAGVPTARSTKLKEEFKTNFSLLLNKIKIQWP